MKEFHKLSSRSKIFLELQNNELLAPSEKFNCPTAVFHLFNVQTPASLVRCMLETGGILKTVNGLLIKGGSKSQKRLREYEKTSWKLPSHKRAVSSRLSSYGHLSFSAYFSLFFYPKSLQINLGILFVSPQIALILLAAHGWRDRKHTVRLRTTFQSSGMLAFWVKLK